MESKKKEPVTWAARLHLCKCKLSVLAAAAAVAVAANHPHKVFFFVAAAIIFSLKSKYICRFNLTTNMFVGNKKKKPEGEIIYGIKLQLATLASLKVNQFIPALEFIAW